ncbi:hypothetical protein ACFL1C_07395 [Pseudomonadota bacterium]
MVSAKVLLTSAVFATLMALGFAAPVVAQDLSDNETCMECHEDADRAPPSNPDRPQVHNPDGGFFVEDHEMWSCNDCHDYITEVPHPDELFEADNEVDCTNCHDEAPTK